MTATEATHETTGALRYLPLAAGTAVGVVVLRVAGLSAGVLAICLTLLAAAAISDMRTMRLPNTYNYLGLVTALLAATLFRHGDATSAFAGAAAGFALFLLLSIVSRGAMGLGDAKLAAFGGALVGLTNLLPALVLASLIAVPPVAFLLISKRISRHDPIPYGPFLALGFAVVALALGTTA